MTGLMAGKRGLVMGVANDHSIAWGCAKVLHAQGAQLAFTYQGEQFGKRVKPLADSVGASHLLPADVQDEASRDAVVETLGNDWGGLDFVIHAIAYSDKNELQGRFADTSRANFLNSLDISCYSLVDMSRRVLPLLIVGKDFERSSETEVALNRILAASPDLRICKLGSEDPEFLTIQDPDNHVQEMLADQPALLVKPDRIVFGGGPLALLAQHWEDYINGVSTLRAKPVASSDARVA